MAARRHRRTAIRSRGGHGVDIADGEEPAGHAVFDQLRHSTDPGGDGGNLAGHGFQRRQAEGLQFAGHEHQVGDRQQFVHPLLFAQEVDPVLDALAVGQPLRRGAVRSVAHHQQARRHLLRDAGKDLDHIEDALDRTEVRKMEQDLFSGIGITRPGAARLSPRGLYSSQLTKLGMTSMGRKMPKSCTVFSRR
jgi:hypothetical protein